MTEFKIIAKTFQGLEEVLAKELINLGANNVEIGHRMVSLTGDKEMLYKANFCTRTAVKILKPIKEFKATDADEVYEAVKRIDWEQYMDVKSTFLVDSVIFSENFRHSKFVAYRVKDAIADYWRDKTGDRPNVGISNPDIRINVHIADSDVTISLDSSGESLHQRGYKTATVPAPINEVLAAGLI
ncbi:MAG: RNA methyltransferase, partial [Bacteroidaceae bacterium]|nr:RNA methyltransferase [Bacteroidaceae bacterium]